MGRSTPSCFRIIACGGSDESVDRDEIDASSENKSPDKRGWSFRKRSARHRVLSNTIVTKTSSENKQISEPISIRSEPQVVSNISEKTSDNIWTEEIPNSITKNATVSTMAMATKSVSEEDDIKCEPVSDGSESAILIIQTAVRRFLAERQLVKHRNVIKLQAAVRGHLVRTHAVGTLRCVQAIVKMQALVRARREKGVETAGVKSKPMYISIEKLLSNRLARQLLESTPMTKQISIKCDPLKSDSAWNWLERWMSVSSPEMLHTKEHDQGKVVNEVETAIPSDVQDVTVPYEIVEDSNVKTLEEKNPVAESIYEPIELNTEAWIEVNSIPENPSSETVPEYELVPEKPVSETVPKHELVPEKPVSETVPELILEKVVSETKRDPEPIPENPVLETKPKPIPENPVSETKSKPIPENLVSEIKTELISDNPVPETEPKRTAKRVATDQPDSEGRKSVFGSRKVSNPAFIAAQSRFEELTAGSKQLKIANSSKQDDLASFGSCSSDPLKPTNSSNHVDPPGSGSSAPENVSPVLDAELDEHLVPHGSIPVQNGGSECGTELSITSTLDSPDLFEVPNKKPEEPKVLNEAICDSNTNTDQTLDDSDIKLVHGHRPKSSHHAYKSNEHESVPQISLPGSPRSHVTISEPQGTPSSQMSTNSKKSKTDKRSTSQKRKSWSTSKKSSPDSAPRTSLDQLPKDMKPGKRRNSFGSPKPDHTDQEPSVPSYMQATESARAKAVANSSPALSPDVHDKDLKKRHSLPGVVNGRQGSPRIQRSMSQALATKGNGNQEKKWQR